MQTHGQRQAYKYNNIGQYKIQDKEKRLCKNDTTQFIRKDVFKKKGEIYIVILISNFKRNFLLSDRRLHSFQVTILTASWKHKILEQF